MEELRTLVTQAAEALSPPERLAVYESAAKYRWLNNPGSYVGLWQNDLTPYLVEPMRCFTDRAFSSVIFAGPAQSGKTDMFLNWLLHSVKCDPMDMMLVEKSQAAARDFSKRRIDRLHRYSPEVGSRMQKGRDSDNTFDKAYRSGMMLSLSWPTVNELSGRPIPRLYLTDYDRMPMDVDGEGSPFDMARTRAKSFGRVGKTVAESSPGFQVQDPKWIRSHPHEAPPCEGILSLFNRGDRRRWYWKCIHCSEWFEPEFTLLKWPESSDIMESAEQAKMMCPKCACLIEAKYKFDLNLQAHWLREGLRLTADDQIIGKPRRSNFASFWLKGPAAAFSTWADLVANYLRAEEEFSRTGSQESLKTTVNTDQGEPFYPRGTERERLPDELKEKAKPLPEKEVPEDGRFLIAYADTQKNMWVVQIFAVSPGNPYHVTVVDRFDIRKSKRLDEDGEHLWVKPHAFLEDWDLLIEDVLEREYKIAGQEAYMGVAFMGVDSGGRHGVTNNAYNWYRKLRREGAGEHQRIFLTKGDPYPTAPRARISYPDAQRKDRKAAARGEIPVLMLNVNTIKDALNSMLERAEIDGGSFSWPDWLEDWWFAEMCAERRTSKGWENPAKARNEAWDLAAYCIGLCIHKKVDQINWDRPPSWAAEWPENPRVRTTENQGVAAGEKGQYSLKKLAKALA